MCRMFLLVCCVAAVIGHPTPAAAMHAGDLDCSDFPDQSAAQRHLDAHPGDPDGLDGDRDGRPCETLPCPCAGATVPAAPAPPPPPPPPPAASAPLALAKTITARVIRVVDGDTLNVRLPTGTTVNVRLIGIDTPETRKPGTPVQCGGPAATARMKRLAIRGGAGRTVTLKTDPTQDRVDRYDRPLVYVSAGGVDFGRTMVSSGWAKVYATTREFMRAPVYRRAQASARAALRGVWRTCGGDVRR